MKLTEKQISKPINEMMTNEEIGRVIFLVSNFKQQFNTRTAALGNRSRHNYDIYTKSVGTDELHVIKRGGEELGAIAVDLRKFWEGDE